jgi:CDP-diacylglycerol--serine O-phosphatidyltransferase
MKRIAVVPTLLTLGNGVCGFVAITVASKIVPNAVDPSRDRELFDSYFQMAGWFIILAMIFDMLDGSVARLSKTASKFGGELDSLCDAISFGVAPAFLVLKLGPGWEPSQFLHQLVACIAALYMVCAVLRLARFNVDNTPDPAGHKRFRGLPSPGAAGCIASLAILRGAFPNRIATEWAAADIVSVRDTLQYVLGFVTPLGALVVALLMVSLVPYPHISKQVFRGRRHVGHIIQVFVAFLIIALLRDLVVVPIFWFYAALFPLRNLVVHGTSRESVAPPPVEGPRI